MNSGKDGYEVGYGKPPKSTQFQKGRSGNPKGRPRGTLNLATVLERTLRERVVVNENGRRKTITKLQAAIKQLVNQAASGDLAALRQLTALVNSAQQIDAESQPKRLSLNETDQEIMAEILQRFATNTKQE
jgi:hypothetical protein